MGTRAMNNIEKAAAKSLKDVGFSVFFEYSGHGKGNYWAKHPKLIFQYHIATKHQEAIEDLNKLKEEQP